MTVRQAVLKAFNDMPINFHINTLIKKVRQYTNRPMLTDGTISRRLRELRNDFEINYDYKSSDFIYNKIKINNQLSIKL
jgi:hypothetical protein